MKKHSICFFTLCLVVMLSACSNESQQQSDRSTEAPETAVRESVIIANAAEPDCFFPGHTSLATNMDEVPILHNIYETPIKLMPDGSKEPLLAESWEISEDGRDYTLYLRQDVTFHDGNPMTAEDVAFSLDVNSSTALGKTLMINYDYSEVIDEYTVVVHLTDPYGPFLNSLASRFALIFEKALYEKVGEDGYNNNPIGTGPYKLVERVGGDHVTLEVNEAYWDGAPDIKHITYRIMTDVNTQMLALENGEIDVLLNANLSPLLRLPDNSDVTWSTCEASSIASILFNCAKGVASDINFRKAVQHAIDKEEIVLAVYEGMATTGDIFMTPAFSGRPDDADITKIEYDPDKAKKYLAQSNYNGEEFVIVVPSGSRDESAAQIVQGQLLEIGINCQINALDAASFAALTSYGTGEFGAVQRAGGVSVLDADGLYTYFNRKVLGGNRYNMGCYTDELESLLDQGRVETDPEKRKALYTQACNNIIDNAYQVVLYYDLSIVAFNKALKGVEPRALTGLYYFNDWSW